MRILSVVVLLVSSISFSKVLPEFPGKIVCDKQLEEKIKSEFKKENINWNKEANYAFDMETYRAQAQFGEWYEVKISTEQPPILSYISKEKNAEYTWTPDCKMQEQKAGAFVFFEKSKKEETFGDKDLAKILEKKKTGLIYVWSPRMVYSVTEIDRYKKVAADLKMEFIPVLDPTVSTNEANAALKKAKKKDAVLRKLASVDFPVKRMDSVELYMKNATLHFPTVMVFKNGKLSDRRIVGILTPDDAKKMIDISVKELN